MVYYCSVKLVDWLLNRSSLAWLPYDEQVQSVDGDGVHNIVEVATMYTGLWANNGTRVDHVKMDKMIIIMQLQWLNCQVSVCQKCVFCCYHAQNINLHHSQYSLASWHGYLTMI